MRPTFCQVLILFTALLHRGAESSDFWESFKRDFNKSYEPEEEENRRRTIFQDNVRFIDDHNRAREGKNTTGYRLQVNQFADLSHEEFVALRTRPLHVSPSRLRLSTSDRSQRLLLPIRSYPAEVDWRESGFVSPVKDQGPCASGAVFAAIGAMEGQERDQLSSLVPISPQQLFDCCGTGSCPDCSSGGGLSPTEYFECVDDIDGLDSDRCYPYQGKCHECRTHSKCISFGIRGYSDIEFGNEQSLMQALSMIGPVAASIHAARPSFQFLKGSDVYDDPLCSSTKLDHSVTIVGYGLQDAKPYWLIKNSWGTDWGDGGYAKIIRNKNMCGIASRAVYPLITTRT